MRKCSLRHASIALIMTLDMHALNTLLASGSVPLCLKTAAVTPISKKSDLYPADLNNYRPVSNPPVAKLLVTVNASQVQINK